MNSSLEWAIIGGGIHGVHIAICLIAQGIALDTLRIFDPEPELLARWKHCTAMTGMSHLRSPMVHHLDADPWSLKRFSRDFADPRPFVAPYDRPSLRLFNAHSDRLIELYGLRDIHVREQIQRIDHEDGEVLISLASGTTTAKNVVLALGQGSSPNIPDAAPSRARHIFEDGALTNLNQKVAIVGAGISGAQLALRLSKEGHDVAIYSEHPLRKHQFDSDPGWLGPRNMEAFGRERSLSVRRQQIQKARYPGSMPPDVHSKLVRRIKAGTIQWTEGAANVAFSSISEDTSIVLATGFRNTRPGGDFVDQLITNWGLPCAECGYPITDAYLRWHPQIFVSGALAELEIGPVSRNISGARRAGDRILNCYMRYPSLDAR